MDKLSITLLERRDGRVERIVDLIAKTIEDEPNSEASIALSVQILIRVGSQILSAMDDKSEEELLHTMKQFTELVRDRLYRQNPLFEQMRISFMDLEGEEESGDIQEESGG